MSAADFFVISPIAAIAAAALAVMLVIAFIRDHLVTATLTGAGLVLSFGLLFTVSSVFPRPVTPLLIIDRYSLFYMGLIIAASLVVVALSYEYLLKREGDQEEYYLLLLLATLGSMVLVVSGHFASFFLGLEILSVSLYALIAYQRNSEHGIEAGIKYLVLAAASAAFLLFGMALIYAETGTLEIGQIATRISSHAGTDAHGTLLLFGMAMMIIGIGFKLAVVPFHLWTPDVYEGAPAPISAFVATVSKGAMFALLLRYSNMLNVRDHKSLFIVFSLIAVSSMFAGNLLALFQDNVKRILAYSSIAHLGYLLVAFLSGGALAATAIAYYLVAYFVTTLAAFGVITILSGKGREADHMDDYRGLASRHPWLAGIFTGTLFSLSGIPLTAGFVGKFYIIAAGAGSSLWFLVVSLIISSVIGLFYYLRIVAVMYTDGKESKGGRIPASKISLGGGVVLGLLTLALLWLGVYPSPLIELIKETVGKMIL